MANYISCAKQSRIHEMNQAVVFGEIILNWCTGQQDTTFALQIHQSAVRLIFAIFQTVPFVAQQQTHFRFVQNV